MAVKGRYVLYGVIPVDHEDNNADLLGDTEEAQKIGGTLPLFATDDRAEAIRIKQAGGFERNGSWLAVTWGKDTVDGGTIGQPPEGA